MNVFLYRAAILTARFIVLCALRVRTIRPELPKRSGGYILALTHLGNLDPILSCVLIRRRVRWMTRLEYFVGLRRWILPKLGAFSVNRFGIPVRSIRYAIDLARSGEAIGVCPEGEVRRAGDCAFRGGMLKKGLCSVAIRAQVPIVPCVMLGTPDLNRVTPWLPTKSGRLWVAYGEPIAPPVGKSTRASRRALCEQLSLAYVELYREMICKFEIDDASVS